MTIQEQIEEPLLIGIDGGGTKCRAIIYTANGKQLGKGLGGPANPFFGVRQAIKSIEEAAYKAIEDSGLSGVSIKNMKAGVGLAGVNLAKLYHEILEWEHPFSELYLTTDMNIANLGANNGQEGGIIIVGTGSCGYIDCSGEEKMFGGYGFPIGDQASGAWMGLKAIQHTLLILDGFSKKDVLSQKVADFYEVETGLELSEKLIGQASKDYAQIASLIFNCARDGDLKANEIVNEGLLYISKLVKKMLKTKKIRLAMIGGLSKYYLPLLPPRVASCFSYAVAQPEVGAVIFAKQKWKDSVNNILVDKSA